MRINIRSTTVVERELTLSRSIVDEVAIAYPGTASRRHRTHAPGRGRLASAAVALRPR
ncbi:MAG: hypothetical protein M3Y87_13965 [Myxococcota bacterium]|nr:hypothetical protein [Myxococcota bacterium]